MDRDTNVGVVDTRVPFKLCDHVFLQLVVLFPEYEISPLA